MNEEYARRWYKHQQQHDPEPVFSGKVGDFVVELESKDGVVKIKVDLGPHNVLIEVNRDLQTIVGPFCV